MPELGTRTWGLLSTRNPPVVFFNVAVSGNKNKKHWRRGDASSVRLEFHWTFLSCFVSTSIAAYGVSPHIKSVSAVTGQDRPRPRFPAEPMNRNTGINA